MSPALQIAVVGVGTYLLRVSIVALVGRGVTIPQAVEAALRLVAPAVLAAILANSLVLDGTEINDSVVWYVAAAAAALVAWRWKSIGITLGAGMAILWVLNGLF